MAKEVIDVPSLVDLDCIRTRALVAVFSASDCLGLDLIDPHLGALCPVLWNSEIVAV